MAEDLTTNKKPRIGEHPACQAPARRGRSQQAGEVEGFVKDAQQQIDLDKTGKDSTFSGSFFRFRLEEACDLLTAQAKRCEQLEGERDGLKRELERRHKIDKLDLTGQDN